jgi:hypothetical protein
MVAAAVLQAAVRQVEILHPETPETVGHPIRAYWGGYGVGVLGVLVLADQGVAVKVRVMPLPMGV